MAGPTLTLVRVGERHTQLGHAVALQKALGCQRLPFIKKWHRAGSRARDVETHVGEAFGHLVTRGFIQCL